MKSASVYNCSILEIDKHHSPQGNMSIIENDFTIPFDVKRVYYLYDVPGGESRAGHSASGSFDVIVDDGKLRRTFTLNRPYQGLLIVPGIWREIENFSSGSVCLVLASTLYDESDYIRDYKEFKEMRNEK